MNKRGTGQKIIFDIIAIGYFMALGGALTSIYWYIDVTSKGSIVAAFSALVVFFMGAGMLQHMMARTNLSDVRIKQACLPG